MRCRIVSVIAMGVMVSGVGAVAAESDKEKAAAAAAEKWAVLVDEGKYADSWREAAEYFKNAVKQEQWEQMARAVRQPLGKLVSRKVKSTTCKTALPGAPDGAYVVIEFESMETALACYRSPEYQNALSLRQPVSRADLIIVEGYEGPQPG